MPHSDTAHRQENPAQARSLQRRLQVARRIGAYLQDLVCTCGDPRQRGKGLTANLAGLWR
ncbi:MAG: type II toxin-antitoxin system RelE family toxin [Cyanobium sp.]